MRCHCNDHIHSFYCYLRNIAYDDNKKVSMWNYPDVLNAR